MLRKIVGVALVIIGLLGLALSLAGTVISRQIIEDFGNAADNALLLTGQSLDTVNDTLTLTKQTLGEVTAGLDTVGEAAVNLSSTLDDTQPILEQVTQVAARDVPDGLDAVQTAIPDVAQAAGAIDDTLSILNAFQVERSIFGVPIQFDLGIDYDPESPLDETVLELGQSLEGMPAGLRALEDDLTIANESLFVIGDNVLAIAEDLDRLNASVGELEPLIDEYLRLASETADLINQTRESLTQQLQTAKLIATLLFVWLGLSQIVPFYLSWELLGNDKNRGNEVQN
jgi:methyl-accepting chemotaxis protein